jgi:hypothetical protein
MYSHISHRSTAAMRTMFLTMRKRLFSSRQDRQPAFHSLFLVWILVSVWDLVPLLRPYSYPLI